MKPVIAIDTETRPKEKRNMEKFFGHITIHAEKSYGSYAALPGRIDIIHNRIDCPICKRKYVATENWGEMNKGDILKCECGAQFKTDSYPYASEAVWEQIK